MTLLLSIQTAAIGIRSGEFTASELLAECLQRADVMDQVLGTFIVRFDESSIRAARAADDDFRRGIDRGPLQGVPIGIKDIIHSIEGPTTAQSLVDDTRWRGGMDGPAVARLRSAGAVVVGKTSTMEFAHGYPDVEKPFPIPRNPWDLGRWAGGSSSGTGNGISAGLFLGGLASDTGGSGRAPAAYCGVTGFKQTYGLVPKSGMIPLSASLDHLTPMARSAWDCAALLSIMAGADQSDRSSVRRPSCTYEDRLPGTLDGVRVGLVRFDSLVENPLIDVDPDLPALISEASEELAACGASVTALEIPHLEELASAVKIMISCEAFALHQDTLAAQWHRYGRSTRRTLAAAALINAGDLTRIDIIRQAARSSIGAIFAEYDVLCMPTTLMGAPPIDVDLSRLRTRSFRAPWNAVGSPALTVPIGFGSEGLPMAMQVVAAPFDDDVCLRVGDAYQRRTKWHLMTPNGIRSLESTVVRDPVAERQA